MIKLSKHTTDEMEGRGILFSYIEAAIEVISVRHRNGEMAPMQAAAK
jgi:hypothetical protein